MKYYLKIQKEFFIFYMILQILSNLKEKFYPGNYIKLNKVYYNIIIQFKAKPDEGCYVYICKNLYYYCVPSGFPGAQQLNKKYIKCN